MYAITETKMRDAEALYDEQTGQTLPIRAREGNDVLVRAPDGNALLLIEGALEDDRYVACDPAGK